MLSLDVRVFSSRSTVLHGQLPQACPSNGSIAVALLFAHAFNQDRVETDRIAQGSRYRRDAPQVPEWCGLVPIETHRVWRLPGVKLRSRATARKARRSCRLSVRIHESFS